MKYAAISEADPDARNVIGSLTFNSRLYLNFVFLIEWIRALILNFGAGSDR